MGDPPDDVARRSRELTRSGRFAESHRILGAAASAADDECFAFAIAHTLYMWGRIHDAIRSARPGPKGGSLSGDDAIAMGWIAHASNDNTSADRWMRDAVASMDAGREAEALVEQAKLMAACGRISEAVDALERASELSPRDSKVEAFLGSLLSESGQLSAAESRLRRLASTNGDDPQQWINLGVTLQRQRRYAEAVDAFGRAIGMGMDRDDYDHISVAIHLREERRLEDSIALSERKLRSNPAADGHYAYALSLLAAGKLSAGWSEYQFRWLRQPSASLRASYAVPAWNGQPLDGRTLLIACEQGFGDSIQFLRYARLAQSLGARTVVQVQKGLHELANRVEGIDKLVDPQGESVSFDYHVDLMTLPHVFGTEVSTIPQHLPYVHADGARASKWLPLLENDRLNVGLAWAGSPKHLADSDRSIRLEDLAPVLGTPGAKFFSVQKGGSEAVIRTLGLEESVIEVGSELGDFADTAAFIDQLDLVICVDTAVAHLAGAMGKDVWVLIATPADWRWLQERSDTPWYPSMRLFRQRERGDWKDVIERVKVALEERVRAGVVPQRVEKPFVALKPALPQRWVAGETKWPGYRPGLSAVIDTRLGLVQYLPDEPVAGDAIAWYGEHLQAQLDLLSRWVVAGSVVVEVCAGIGLHTLGLSRSVGPTGHLFTYEDDAIKRQIAGHNLGLHKVTWVTPMRRRLGSVAEAQSADAPPREESLDDLQLERLDWLKVNDGGRALEVLEGAEESVWRLRPKLFLSADDAAQLELLIARVKDLGYRCWVHEAALYNPGNFNRREGDIFNGRTSLALLAIPEEIDVEDEASSSLDER